MKQKILIKPKLKRWWTEYHLLFDFFIEDINFFYITLIKILKFTQQRGQLFFSIGETNL